MRHGSTAFLVTLFCALSSTAWAHDVKDPVCRMMTDTDTTPYRETIHGKTYYFCSDACKAKFDKAPTSYVTLNAALANGRVRTYRLAFLPPVHPLPNHPVALNFTIREMPGNKIVRDFEIVHQKRLHFLIVSADMAYFEHQHPMLSPNGQFRLTWTFPQAGRYYLYADCTPTDGDNQILRTWVDIGPSLRRTPAPTRLTVDSGKTKTIGDTRVRLAIRPGQMTAGRQGLLTYTLTDKAGRPRTDMQLILGVMGHLIALRTDRQTIIHTHALHGVQSGSYGAAMLAMMQAGQQETVPVTPEMVTLTGPALTFKLTLPKPGLYKLWAQFQRKNQWLTVPFTVLVK